MNSVFKTCNMSIDDCAPLHLRSIGDVLEVMQKKETSVYARSSSFDDLNGLWRRLLIEWMYYVVDYCKLQRQSVGAAAFFLDVAMSKGLIETREEYQLAAATALQLALKTVDSAIIKLEKLVNLGRGSFTENDVVRMETKILRVLNWHLHPPSAYCFLHQYELLLPSSTTDATKEMIREVTKLLSELVVSDHKYNRYNPSSVAYATMLMALELIDYRDLPVHQRQCFVMNMSKFAGKQSNSPLILKIFENLKDTLDASEKLPSLMESLSVARKQKAKRETRLLSKKLSSISAARDSSPRDVMARLSRR